MFLTINQKFLQFFYNALLTGMPSLTYNPINKNTLHAPFNVNEGSTYINYKLNTYQIKSIQNYLSEKGNLKIVPTKLFKNDKKNDFYLSINIYNCSSPIFNFLSQDPVTRCEINTYVINEKNEFGTCILDYTSNILSLDPDNIFKTANPTKFVKDISKNILECYSYSKNIIFEMEYDYSNIMGERKIINEKLIKYTDKIFYNNGLYDKLYYDSTLLHNKLIMPRYYDVHFNFLDILFDKPHSIFYFQDKINFVGGMWDNLYN